MKKFSFPLDTVLDYKQQILDSLKIEHGAILAQVRRQEEVLASVQAQYAATNADFREKERSGLTIAGALIYEIGLRALEEDIARETAKLDALHRQELEKREQLVESKIDTTSLERLREKKLEGYNKAVQKSQEQFIDELVMAARSNGISSSIIM
ncbi:MAG: fliJ [Firmicutes bacterium]|nr:fliJ [Bacillota bacterium]